jgi:long-chain fatty acid transport protein
MSKTPAAHCLQHRRRAACAAPLLVACTLISSAASAGGLYSYEVGTSDVGLASAGYGARAQDASTILTNVAGMTRLDGEQFLVGAQALYGSVQFSTSSASRGLGSDNGGNAVGWFPGASGFYSYSVSHDVKLGVGVASTFGAALKYDDNWVGRYHLQNATLLGVSILPSAAYRLNDKWSVGVSLNVMPSILQEKVAINTLGGPDGQMSYKDSKVGWGGNFGLLYEFSPDTRVGLTYNTQVKLDYSNQPTFTNLGVIAQLLVNRRLSGTNLNLNLTLPQQTMLSGFHQLNDRLALLASVGWQQWAKFGDVEIGVDSNNPQSLTTSIPFKNTWHFAAGAQYKLSAPWTLNAGISYDTKYQSGNVSVILPTNDAWRFGLGADNQLSKTTSWGLYTEYLYGGSPTVNVQGTVPVALGGRGTFSGTYNNENIIYLGAYLTSRF